MYCRADNVDGAEQDVATSVIGLVGDSHASLAQASDDMPSATLPSPGMMSLFLGYDRID